MGLEVKDQEQNMESKSNTLQVHPQLVQRRRSVIYPGSFVLPRPRSAVKPPIPVQEEHLEQGKELKLPLLKTKAQWRALQDREENGINQSEIDIETSKKNVFREKDNIDASIYLCDIIDNLVPKIKKSTSDNKKKAKQFLTKFVRRLTDDPVVVRCFRRKQFRSDKLWSVTQTDVARFDMRIYLKAFLFPGEFEVHTGLHKNIPAGNGEYRLSNCLTAQEQKTVRQNWNSLLTNLDCLSPRMASLRLGEAVNRTLSNAKNEFSEVTKYESDSNGGTNVTILGSIHIRMIASIPGQGLPRGVTLTHALPKHLPYCTAGRRDLRTFEDDAINGKVLWYADANLTKFWTLNFEPIMTRLESASGQVPREMTFEECRLVFQVFQACNPKLSIISPDLLRQNLFSIWKRPFQSAQDIFEETIVLLLRKLAVCLRTGRSPHFFFSAVNIMENSRPDSEDVVAAAQLLDKLARILWIKPDRIVEFTKMPDSKRGEKSSKSKGVTSKVTTQTD